MNSYYFFVSTGVVIILLSLARIPQDFKDFTLTFIGLLVVFVSQKYIKKDATSESSVVNINDTNLESTNHSS